MPVIPKVNFDWQLLCKCVHINNSSQILISMSSHLCKWNDDYALEGRLNFSLWGNIRHLCSSEILELNFLTALKSCMKPIWEHNLYVFFNAPLPNEKNKTLDNFFVILFNTIQFFARKNSHFKQMILIWTWLQLLRAHST